MHHHFLSKILEDSTEKCIFKKWRFKWGQPTYLSKAPFYFRSLIRLTRHCSFYHGSLHLQASLHWLPFLLTYRGLKCSSPVYTTSCYFSSCWLGYEPSQITNNSLFPPQESEDSAGFKKPVSSWSINNVWLHRIQALVLSTLITPHWHQQGNLHLLIWLPASQHCTKQTMPVFLSPLPPFTFLGSSFSHTLWRIALKPTERKVGPLVVSFLLLSYFSRFWRTKKES